MGVKDGSKRCKINHINYPVGTKCMYLSLGKLAALVVQGYRLLDACSYIHQHLDGHMFH